MAQVTSAVRQTIDEWLDYLTEAWQRLPQTAADLDQWDLAEQIDYVEEWTPKEEVATHLRRLVMSPDATAEQRRRYEQLARLMDTNRPILEHLRGS